MVQRGNDRQPCFLTVADYRRYLRGLQEAALACSCRIHAYVLMTNHVHLLVTPSEPFGISHNADARSWLRELFQCNPPPNGDAFWEGRFKASLVDSERYLLTCYRYIEMNAVRAAMVASPRDYPWSSYACNADGQPDAVVSPHAQSLALGHSDEERDYVQQQRALGSLRLQAAIEATTGRCASVRSCGRPATRDAP